MKTSKAKINSFWKKILHYAGSGAALYKKISKNVDFSFWGKQSDFYKLHFFVDFKPLWRMS